MDGLSGVASGMAVISLSLQLIQSIAAIRTQIRHVKGAPAEVTRLTGLLDRLSMLLDEIRQTMEYQSSHGADGIPMPSMTIFDCLKGCEREIEPLMQMIEEYGEGKMSAASKTARLRRNVRVGFRAKDIAGFEDRIQQEVNRLNTALTINNTRQLHALHILVANQAAFPRGSMHVETTSKMLEATGNASFPADASGHTIGTSSTSAFKRASLRISSSRQRFGIWRQEIIRTQIQRCDTSNALPSGNKDESYEEVYFWACQMLGYGIRWSRQRLYGTVLPSISTFPVVPDFSVAVNKIIWYGDASDLEQAFRKGEVHPFTRDQLGVSLLHLAASYYRADICQLLRQLGVNPDADFYGDYPIDFAIHNGYPMSASNTVDTLRFLSQEPYFAESTDTICQRDLLRLPLEVLGWFWTDRAEIFYGRKTSEVTDLLLPSLVHTLDNPYTRAMATEYLKYKCASELRNSLREGSLRFVESLFSLPLGYSWDTASSYEVGEAFIHLTHELGIDVNECIRKEIERYQSRQLGPLVSFWGEQVETDRKLVAEHIPDHGWKLGWEWAYDGDEPGYLLVSEYSILAAENYWGSDFPFLDYEYPLHLVVQRRELQNSRFERRSAAKYRKELARTGQKQSRCKMPGSWIN